jgi:putative transposase
VERDKHLISLCRYVERNALRVKLCRRAEVSRWGSLWRRTNQHDTPWLMDWADCPVDRPADWLEFVNRPQTSAEVAAIVESIRRGRPYGQDKWQRIVARKLGLGSTLRPRGRPQVRQNKDSRPL